MHERCSLTIQILLWYFCGYCILKSRIVIHAVGPDFVFFFCIFVSACLWNVLYKEQWKRDMLDSGHVSNIPDSPQVSTNENAKFRGVALDNGSMQFLLSFAILLVPWFRVRSLCLFGFFGNVADA